MTCIVGLVDKENHRVVMGGDCASSDGSSIFIRKDEKVFRKGAFIIGCTTSFRMMQLLRFSFEPPIIENCDIYTYMCTEFINGVRKCFQEGGFSYKNTEGGEIGGAFLVAYKDRLFKIDQDFQVAENIDGIDAIGCGADFALGALRALTMKDLSPQDKVYVALDASEYYSPGVCSPFIIWSTYTS